MGLEERGIRAVTLLYGHWIDLQESKPTLCIPEPGMSCHGLQYDSAMPGACKVIQQCRGCTFT